jgi:hypothetical protein
MMSILLHGLILIIDDETFSRVQSEKVALVERPAEQGVHRYSVVLADRLRGRHFAFVVDRSVCAGEIVVNEQKLMGFDADEVFAFDRANSVQVSGCVERTPEPLRLFAHPKVLIEEARAVWSEQARELRLEVRLRNTLANSVSVSLGSPDVAGWGQSFFLGPQTSQTRSLVLRLRKYQAELRLELEKFAEAVEGGYSHIRKLPVTRLNE